MNIDEHLINGLPDPEAASRFLSHLVREQPSALARLKRSEGLLSDILTLVSFSPLLATTLLQNPDYFWWLGRKRRESGVRGTEELLESLARFSLTNSQLDPQVLYARFRRRELLRIYLRDIRRLATIAEITEEISNLADAILESALKTARREIDNRFGSPQETDANGRLCPARFCIAALGKLGSRELNYSSDIDLLFLYSAEGTTSGGGSRGSVTNREYFVKLAEFACRLVGSPSGEGAAYRVDLRLRPYGTLGALTMSVGDTVRYYRTEARGWERQVMIRSRGCAGDIELFKEFFGSIEDLIFSKDETVETALANVHRSKEKIDHENMGRRGFNVKLGRGGIREIEFIAQALQLAYGGHDRWLRSPHTLISLARINDRGHLSETELTGLATAYEFLRRTEHVLQMENGVQTHTIPDEPELRSLIGRRMTFAAGGNFERDLKKNTSLVSRVFLRVFGKHDPVVAEYERSAEPHTAQERTHSHIMASIEKSDVTFDATVQNVAVLGRMTQVSPHFAAMLAANPHLVNELPDPETDFVKPDYQGAMMAAVDLAEGFRARLSELRRQWSHFLLEIVVRDVFERITIREAKQAQTQLAEACIAAAIRIVGDELEHRYGDHAGEMHLSVLALGKLGGRGLDYDSDLDLIMVYDDASAVPVGVTAAEYYSRAVELFVTTLSSMTRDGNLYRVDLRLRPYGSKGLSAMSGGAFLEYMRETAAVWEMLAFVKLRAVGGDLAIGRTVEIETRKIIHDRAAAVGGRELSDETRRVRQALEKQRVRSPRTAEIDIKYGAGGMLDVYFAMRYLQLRDNIPDEPDDRSTPYMLERLKSNGSLTADDYADLSNGYDFLGSLDHNLRLTVGRTTRLPLGNQTALATIAARMGLTASSDLLEQLALHRISIRSGYENILGSI